MQSKGSEEARNSKGHSEMLWMWRGRAQKWECPRKKEGRKEEAAPPREIWEKVKKHSGARGLPPRGARMSMEGWTT